MHLRAHFSGSAIDAKVDMGGEYSVRPSSDTLNDQGSGIPPVMVTVDSEMVQSAFAFWITVIGFDSSTVEELSENSHLYFTECNCPFSWLRAKETGHFGCLPISINRSDMAVFSVLNRLQEAHPGFIFPSKASVMSNTGCAIVQLL